MRDVQMDIEHNRSKMCVLLNQGVALEILIKPPKVPCLEFLSINTLL